MRADLFAKTEARRRTVSSSRSRVPSSSASSRAEDSISSCVETNSASTSSSDSKGRSIFSYPYLGGHRLMNTDDPVFWIFRMVMTALSPGLNSRPAGRNDTPP